MKTVKLPSKKRKNRQIFFGLCVMISLLGSAFLACLADNLLPQERLSVEVGAMPGETQRQTGLARVGADDVNFREQPRKGDLITRLSKDDAVFVFDQRTMDDGYTWYHVRAMHGYKNKEGWIRGDLLILPDTLFCNLIDVAVGKNHVIALKADGSVIAGGTNYCDPCNVVGLYDAVNVDAGLYTSFVFFRDKTYWAQGRALGHPPQMPQEPIVTATVLDDTWAGLYENGSMFLSDRYYADGRLITINDARNHSPNITQIEEGVNLMVCLTKQGKPYVYGYNRESFLDVESWESITKVSASTHVVGLRTDGTVVASGENQYGECTVEEWTNIIDIAVGESYTIGLRSDGTVVATGDNQYGACDVEDFRDIVQVEADRLFWVGRTKQGTLMYAGLFSFLDQTDATGRIYVSSGN